MGAYQHSLDENATCQFCKHTDTFHEFTKVDDSSYELQCPMCEVYLEEDVENDKYLSISNIQDLGDE